MKWLFKIVSMLCRLAMMVLQLIWRGWVIMLVIGIVMYIVQMITR